MAMGGRYFPVILGFIVVACLPLPGTAATVEKAHDNKALALDAEPRRITLDHDQALAKQTLVICNAFSYKKPLHVTRVRSELRLTSENPVHYKECRELNIPLEEGDQLEFKAGALSVGTFFASGLPKKSSSLLLVPHRKSLNSLNLAFDSHAFSELESPQIAVVDAYKGQEQGHIQIMDATQSDKDSKANLAAMLQRVEDLKYNSVIALNPGEYKVALVGGDSVAKDAATSIESAPLHVEGKTKYVVMRVGAGNGNGKIEEFPQELVVFPQFASQIAAQSSAPSAMRWNLAALVAAIFACLASAM